MPNNTYLARAEIGFLPVAKPVWHLYPLLKRAIDITVAVVGLLALVPFFALLAVYIKFESPGAVFFKQIRVGKGGREFNMWKFRSMCENSEELKEQLLQEVDADVSGGVRFKMKDDPRITTSGKFIRKFSIDELPQFLNILWGDMTLVGPRPALPQEVAMYTDYQRLRLQAVPGLTCIWQVSGRSDIPFEQQVDMDLEYIKTASFWQDIGLLLRTVPAVLAAKGSH